MNERYQLIILSDTFYEFGMPFMKKLGYPVRGSAGRLAPAQSAPCPRRCHGRRGRACCCKLALAIAAGSCRTGRLRPRGPLFRLQTLFCHKLDVDGETGRIIDYKLRQPDPKRKCIEAFRQLVRAQQTQTARENAQNHSGWRVIYGPHVTAPPSPSALRAHRPC